MRSGPGGALFPPLRAVDELSGTEVSPSWRLRGLAMTRSINARASDDLSKDVLPAARRDPVTNGFHTGRYGRATSLRRKRRARVRRRSATAIAEFGRRPGRALKRSEAHVPE